MAKHENENPLLSNDNETPPPPPKPGRGTCNSQHAGLLLEPMETSQNDKEDTLDKTRTKKTQKLARKTLQLKTQRTNIVALKI